MRMIEIIATAESVEQGEKLLQVGADTIYIGEDKFGLRLPASFTGDEIKTLTQIAHHEGKQVGVAVNALMHNERIKQVLPYLRTLEEIGVDWISVGDPGVIHLLQTNKIELPFVYDAQTMVTSANQVNFWAKRGAVGAVLARELTYEELKTISEQATVPVEVQVYGSTCIHQSKRPLVSNYMHFVEQANDTAKEKGLFISEAKNEDTHYSIYEDMNGTHIFATDDINLILHLQKLKDVGIRKWKLDGLFVQGDTFVDIVRLFVNERDAIMNNTWSVEALEERAKQLHALHPKGRGLGTGFFLKDPADIK